MMSLYNVGVVYGCVCTKGGLWEPFVFACKWIRLREFSILSHWATRRCWNEVLCGGQTIHSKKKEKGMKRDLIFIKWQKSVEGQQRIFLDQPAWYWASQQQISLDTESVSMHSFSFHYSFGHVHTADWPLLVTFWDGNLNISGVLTVDNTPDLDLGTSNRWFSLFYDP